MKKYTVFYDQRNRTNFQVLAENEEEARGKGDVLYEKWFCIPSSYAQEEWIVESDGEDK